MSLRRPTLDLKLPELNWFEPGAVTCHPPVPRNRDEIAQAVSMKQCYQSHSQMIYPSVGIVPKKASDMTARREQKGKQAVAVALKTLVLMHPTRIVEYAKASLTADPN